MLEAGSAGENPRRLARGSDSFFSSFLCGELVLFCGNEAARRAVTQGALPETREVP